MKIFINLYESRSLVSFWINCYHGVYRSETFIHQRRNQVTEFLKGRINHSQGTTRQGIPKYYRRRVLCHNSHEEEPMEKDYLFSSLGGFSRILWEKGIHWTGPSFQLIWFLSLKKSETLLSVRLLYPDLFGSETPSVACVDDVTNVPCMSKRTEIILLV